MKQTLLELTQAILNTMNGDEVNSIGDTVESLQIAQEIKTTYYSMLGDIEWPFQYNLIALEPSGDTDKPTHMKAPEAVDNFKWIRYKNDSASNTNYTDIKYLCPEEFLDMVAGFNTSDTRVTVKDYSGAYFDIGTTKHPSYYTMFDDVHVVFDSYNSSLDDTLQASKVIAMGQTIPNFIMEDTAVPDLPAKYFPMLLAEATSACMFYFKQTPDQIDIQRARKLYVRHFNDRNRSQESNKQLQNFGRS